MKKIISLVLVVIMLFPMTSVSFAAEATGNTASSVIITTDDYLDHLESKLESENFFIRIISRLVIIGIVLGFIDVQDLEDWFNITVPDNGSNNDDDTTEGDKNTNAGWEDGTEVTLHPEQSFPYTKKDITVTDIKITKEHCDSISSSGIATCKYNIEIQGNCPGYVDAPWSQLLYVVIRFENDPTEYKFSYDDSDSGFTYKGQGNFEFKCTRYSSYDSNRFMIANAYYLNYESGQGVI